MENFETFYAKHRTAVERYIHYRISHPADAEDVLQDVLSSAALKWNSIQDSACVKAWLIGIARNKCADYFRRKYRQCEVPLENASHLATVHPYFSLMNDSPVLDTLDQLKPTDRLVLQLFYWQDLSITEIAQQLSLPLGTVKSRLHHARNRFREAFPYKPKGEHLMKTIMPKVLPDYTITPSSLPPFSCKWEELMGWFIVPRLGEKLSWAMYDFPARLRTEADELSVVGRAMVHGIEGVEIEVRTMDPMSNNQTGDSSQYVQRSFVAQLTDTHCRILSETHTKDQVKYTWTFMDGDEFHDNWGFGETNCGNETNLRSKGLITRVGNVLTTVQGKKELMDVVGRYTVTINGKTYDTICVIMHEAYMGGMVSEQFIDSNGRTILWRRFNADHWKIDHYGKSWSEMLPDSEVLIINGITYVHWYDCITSYILT